MKVAIVLNSPTPVKKVDENDIIYTDGGYRNQKYLKGKNTLALVGDFDTPKKIPKGVNIVRLNPEKDFTDGERAIRYAKEIGAESVTIYGAENGKIEHVLGNIALLKIAKDQGIDAVISANGRTVRLLGAGRHEFKVDKNSAVSFIPYGGECEFIGSNGLYYPLAAKKLTPADTLGISNIAEEETVSVEIEKGETLICY